MIDFKNKITILRPVNEVYPFVANLENLPKWNYFVTNVEKRSKGKNGIGAKYHQIRKSDSQDLRITEFERNKTLTIETIPPSRPALTRKMVFHEQDGTTSIEDHWQLETGGIGILERLASTRVKKAVSENLGKLKELLESGRTTLQDGRRIIK